MIDFVIFIIYKSELNHWKVYCLIIKYDWKKTVYVVNILSWIKSTLKMLPWPWSSSKTLDLLFGTYFKECQMIHVPIIFVGNKLNSTFITAQTKKTKNSCYYFEHQQTFDESASSRLSAMNFQWTTFKLMSYLTDSWKMSSEIYLQDK